MTRAPHRAPVRAVSRSWLRSGETLPGGSRDTATRVGRYLIESDRISRNGRTVALAPKELATLRLLARNSPRLVTVEVIGAEVWHGVGSKASITQCITKLRRKLGTTSSSTSFVIETAYGRGYRVVNLHR